MVPEVLRDALPTLPFDRSGSPARPREVRDVERRVALEQLHELARKTIAEVRIRNGIALSGQAVIGVAQLDALISAVSVDKPFLELELRQFQRFLGVALGSAVMSYLGVG